MAREAADKFDLERVLFVPAGRPPHKSDSTGASYEDRYRMVELACQPYPRFEPSRIEEGQEMSYSIVTIERVRATAKEIYFLIGADAFAEIRTWFRWQKLIQLTDFIVVTRPGHEYDCPAGARVHRLDTVALPVSSSEIRVQLSRGKVPAELPATVADYIVQKGLYRFPHKSASSAQR